MRIKLNGLLVCVILLMIGSNICFAKQRKAVPADIFVDKDVEVKYKDVKLQKTDWGYVVRYSRVKENEWAYILTKLQEKYDRFSVRFKCRVYPVDPDTRNMYRVTNAYVISAFRKLKPWTSVNGIYNLPQAAFSSTLDFTLRNVLNFSVCQNSFNGVITLRNSSPEKMVLTSIFNNSYIGMSCFYRVYDVKITIDKSNNIICEEINGRKNIIEDNIVKDWTYYGINVKFCPLKKNKKIIIAPELEFTKIDFINGKNTEPTATDTYPRFSSNHYLEAIKEYKDIDAMYWLGMNYYEGKGGSPKDYCQAVEWFRKAASKKHVLAQYQLGLCYLYGTGAEQNSELALDWLVKSADRFYDKALTMVGQTVLNGTREVNPIKRDRYLQSFLGPAFLQGNANSFFLEGYCVYHDIIKIEDIKEAFGLFKNAAQRGHPKAYYYMGLLHAEPPVSPKGIFTNHLKAAELKFIPAYVKLGDCFLNGTGTAKDIDKALTWYNKAVAGKNPEGLFKVGCCYAAGIGVKQNLEKAEEFFQKASADAILPQAEIGLTMLKMNNSKIKELFFSGQEEATAELLQQEKAPEALFCLALCLKYGIGIKKDLKTAFLLLLKTQNLNSCAALEIGDCYERGIGTTNELYRAEAFFNTAAKDKSGYAAYRLAELYIRLRNSREAFKWYGIAAQRENADAAFKFGMTIVNDKSGKAIDYRKAVKVFQAAAKLGNVEALCVLGNMFYNGQGVEADKAKASAFWSKYEDAFKYRENNSIHGIYWKDFPAVPPVEYDEDGLPKQFFSSLKSREEILEYYEEY